MSEAAEWLEKEFDKAYKAGNGRQPLDIYNYSGSRGEDVALPQPEGAGDPLARALAELPVGALGPRERARRALQALLKRQRGSHE